MLYLKPNMAMLWIFNYYFFYHYSSFVEKYVQILLFLIYQRHA